MKLKSFRFCICGEVQYYYYQYHFYGGLKLLSCGCDGWWFDRAPTDTKIFATHGDIVRTEFASGANGSVLPEEVTKRWYKIKKLYSGCMGEYYALVY
ncbi:hypothetical protein FOZ62_023325 [Perkinsus olseni]|uniref:Uncharacterized protein n=1 Tax=Perkinsus olseni TaxID=32597 RepID=A0A7J6RGD0_PEROL|nr:hypothetical protein FOZ62_023325 [Perkinsus olseni]